MISAAGADNIDLGSDSDVDVLIYGKVSNGTDTVTSFDTALDKFVFTSNTLTGSDLSTLLDRDGDGTSTNQFNTGSTSGTSEYRTYSTGSTGGLLDFADKSIAIINGDVTTVADGSETSATATAAVINAMVTTTVFKMTNISIGDVALFTIENAGHTDTMIWTYTVTGNETEISTGYFQIDEVGLSLLAMVDDVNLTGGNLIGSVLEDKHLGTSADEEFFGGPNVDKYIASTGTDNIHTGGGSDKLVVTGDLFLEGAELLDGDSDGVFDDLAFYIDDETDGLDTIYTTTVVNHLSDPLVKLIFDFDEDGVLDLFFVADAFDQSGASNNMAIAGAVTADTIDGGSGDDILLGNAGDDILSGGSGDDYIDGGDGSNTINGGADDDTVTFHKSSAGVVVDLSGGGTTFVTHGSGTDSLQNIEHIEGSEHVDTIIGDTGYNEIMGLESADTLTGGVGGDRFIYESIFDSEAGDGDTITDFEAGVGAGVVDILDIADIVDGATFSFLGNSSGGSLFTGGGDVEAQFNQSTKLLEISTDADTDAEFEITLQNVDFANLTSDDFDTGSGGGG